MLHEEAASIKTNVLPHDVRIPIKSFVLPFPGETAFSMLARHHLLHESCSAKALVTRFFGTSERRITSAFPNGLDHFYHVAPSGLWRDFGEFLERHTILPYHRPFLNSQAVEKLAKLSERFVLTTKVLGVTSKWSDPSSAQPKYCPICILEDHRLRGQPYWHREHQIPGVMFCNRHKLRLLDRCPSCGIIPGHGRRLYLPTIRCACGHELSTKNADACSDSDKLLAQSLATFSVALLDEYHGPIDKSLLTEFYRHTLRERGYFGRYGCYKERLWQSIQEAYTHDYLTGIGLSVATETCPRWLWSLVTHSSRQARHPLHHAMLLTFLFPVFTRFKEALSGFIPEKRKDGASTTMACKQSDKIDPLLVDKVYLALETEGKSLYEVARESGLSRHKINVLAGSVQVRLTPLNQKKNQSILEDLRAGVPCAEIVKIHSVSLYRVQILSAGQPELAKNRRLLRQATELLRHKTQILQFLSKNPGVNRRKIATDCSGAYIYVFRRDEAWIDRHLPPQEVVPIADYWVERDEQLVVKLRFVADKLRNSPTKPVRIKKRRLFKEARVMFKVYCSSNKLPKTTELLHELVDSPESFYRRKIVWAIRELEKSETPVTKGAVIKMVSVQRQFRHLIDEVFT